MATSYRCSKSALNQLIKCFSLDIPEVCIFVFLIYEKKFFFLGSFSFCKSWTRSNGYGKRKRKNGKKEKFWKSQTVQNFVQAPLTVDHVAERITKLASNATKAMSGQFLDFDGELIPYWFSTIEWIKNLIVSNGIFCRKIIWSTY